MLNKFYSRMEQTYSALRYTQRINRQLAPLDIVNGRVKICFEDNGLPLHDIGIERQLDHYRLIFQRNCDLTILRQMVKMAAAYVYWLSLCPPDISTIAVNGSDGERHSHARFTPSSRTEHHIPIVDAHFFHNRGFEADRHAGIESPTWQTRSDEITWRGAISGPGWLNCNILDRFNPNVIARVRMAMLLMNQPDIDVKLVGWKKLEPAFRRDGLALGILGQPIASSLWQNRKYAIDIDGATNTWSNLLVRMLYGCCVLKVESEMGYRQWYYDDLKAWVHYVPVKSDMSDFLEKIDWVRSNQKLAEEIAKTGQTFAKAMHFDREARVAANLITEHT